MKNRPAVFLNKPVVLTIGTTVVLSLAVLAFRYKNVEPYIPVKISVRESDINVGDLLRFTADAKDIAARDLVWDYGDTSVLKGSGEVVTHRYTTPGNYNVTLIVDGKYREYKTICVTEALPPDSAQKPQLRVACPSTATVGELVSFEDFTFGAESWKWEFGETDSVDATTQRADYRFTTPGSKYISLVVNGEMQWHGKMEVKKAAVKPPALGNRGEQVHRGPSKEPLDSQLKNSGAVEIFMPEKTPPVVKVRYVSNSEIEDMLRQVIDGQKDASAFSECLCGDLNLKVTYNDKPMPFSQMCGRLQGEMKKSGKVKSLKAVCDRDPDTNCIASMTITAKKKWLGL